MKLVGMREQFERGLGLAWPHPLYPLKLAEVERAKNSRSSAHW